MTIEGRSDPLRHVPSKALLPFVALTFAITWGTIGFYIFWPEVAARSLGQISGRHPAFFLATWAPGLAAFAVVLGYTGVPGARAFVARLLLWRCPRGWAAFLLLGVPLVFVAGSLTKGGSILAPVLGEGIATLLGATFLMLFLGPIEEFGWRGVAQPVLQRHLAPLWAGVLIGATWGLWHLPAFYLSGTVQSGWSFTPFFVGNIALAVLVTPLFNRPPSVLLTQPHYARPQRFRQTRLRGRGRLGRSARRARNRKPGVIRRCLLPALHETPARSLLALVYSTREGGGAQNAHCSERLSDEATPPIVPFLDSTDEGVGADHNSDLVAEETSDSADDLYRIRSSDLTPHKLNRRIRP